MQHTGGQTPPCRASTKEWKWTLLLYWLIASETPVPPSPPCTDVGPSSLRSDTSTSALHVPSSPLTIGMEHCLGLYEFSFLDLKQCHSHGAHLTLGSWEASTGRDVNPFAELRHFQWVAEKQSRCWLPWHRGGVTFFSKLQICSSDLGLQQQEEIHPVQCISRGCGRLMGLGSKWFYLWSSECGAGSLSQKHPHTPSLRQNVFVPVHETYYGSNSCRAIRKRKVHESDSVGLPATLNMIINHARY